MNEEVRNALRTSDAESPKPELVPIGERLALIRGEAGLTQKEFAKDLGVPEKTYGRWERGVREISAEGLAQLAGRGWSLNWLVDGSGAQRVERPGRLREPDAVYSSQALSEHLLTVALELGEKAAEGLTWVPKAMRARAVIEAYMALLDGFSYSELLKKLQGVFERERQGEVSSETRPGAAPAIRRGRDRTSGGG